MRTLNLLLVLLALLLWVPAAGAQESGDDGAGSGEESEGDDSDPSPDGAESAEDEAPGPVEALPATDDRPAKEAVIAAPPVGDAWDSGADEEDDDAEAAEAAEATEPGEAADPPKAKPRISDYIHTTLTFYVGDDNLLAGNEDGSPTLGMANEYPELFFEGLNTEKQKVVSESHLVLYGKAPGFIPFVDTEAAFVAEFELTRDPDDNQLIGRFKDDGSWIGATFWFDRSKTGSHIKLTAWPYSANRFRLGYTYDLTWGGNTIWARNRGPVPGIKLHLDLQRFYAFVGAKALVQLRADNNETENYWGVLGGLGPNFDFGPQGALHFSYDASGGYFARGTFQQDPFRSTKLEAFGLSQRAQLTLNTTMGISPDLRLLANDPERRRTLTNVPDFEGTWGFGIAGEFTTVWQTLIDANDPSQLNLDNALTLGVFAQGRFARSMRVGLDLVYRDVSFLVFNVPGLTPYLSFVEDTLQTPQLYGALWWDWYLEKAHLTPGFVLGLMHPASLASAPDATGARKLEIIRQANDYELMPDGTEDAFTILSVKGSLKWHLSDLLAMIGELSFTQDFNTSKVVTNEETGVGERVLDSARAKRLGLNLLIQARF